MPLRFYCYCQSNETHHQRKPKVPRTAIAGELISGCSLYFPQFKGTAERSIQTMTDMCFKTKKTPMEMWTGTVPKKRRKKLNAKAIKCILWILYLKPPLLKVKLLSGWQNAKGLTPAESRHFASEDDFLTDAEHVPGSTSTN